MKLTEYYTALKARSYRKCFEDRNTKGQSCKGLTGGDKYTNYLNYKCVGCPYLKLEV